MNKKTYAILSRVPLIGVIVKNIICDPSLHCSPMLNEGLHPAILDYMKKHPDTQITRSLVKKIISSK